MLKEMKRKKSKEPTKQDKKPVVVPYIHKASHKLKKIGARHELNVVFSAPVKLKGMCQKVNDPEAKKEECRTRHANRYVECEVGIVYTSPLTCGKAYIGQSGRSLNERLKEHRYACQQMAITGNLSMQCRECGCRPMLEKRTVLAKSKNKTTREIWEAFHISDQKALASVQAPFY